MTEVKAPKKAAPVAPTPTVQNIKDNINQVVAKTASLPEDTKALTAETRDQLIAEAKKANYEKNGDNELDTLALEQIDHARTLADALGVGENQEDTATLLKNAQKRNAVMENKTRDTTNDAKLESIPATWRIEATGDGNVEAVNIHTGREYSGPAKGLFANAEGE